MVHNNFITYKNRLFNDIQEHLYIRPAPKNLAKVCAMNHRGGITKTFLSKTELVKFVAQTYGGSWEQDLMSKEKAEKSKTAHQQTTPSSATPRTATQATTSALSLPLSPPSPKRPKSAHHKPTASSATPRTATQATTSAVLHYLFPYHHHCKSAENQLSQLHHQPHPEQQHKQQHLHHLFPYHHHLLPYHHHQDPRIVSSKRLRRSNTTMTSSGSNSR